MLLLRATKKVRDRLKDAPAAGPDDESTSVLGDWFVNALFWKPQVALVVNSRTFLPVFLPLAPARTLLDRIPDAIESTLRAHGVSDDVIAAERDAMAEVRVAPTNDRRVVGVMNEFGHLGEVFVAELGLGLADLSMRMSDIIVGPLDRRSGTPARELATVLGIDTGDVGRSSPQAEVIAAFDADPASASTPVSPKKAAHDARAHARTASASRPFPLR